VEKIGIGEAIFQEAEAIDNAAPAPTFVGDIENVDLEDVTGFRAFDENGAGQGVNAATVDV